MVRKQSCSMPLSSVAVLCWALCWLIVSAHTGTAQAAEYVLPDTGQTKCYDDYKEIPCPKPDAEYYGQDGNYQGPQPAYRDNGNGTVTDLNTGLMWQQGDDHNNSYYTWQEAVDYCSGLDLAGHSDWRLPTINELVSIVSIGRSNPSIDIQFFPGCRSSNYWSGSTLADYPDDAWYVYFYYGYVYANDKAGTFFVRCVRAGP